MSTTAIFIVIVVIAAVIAAVGIIAVASRRKDSEGAVTQGELDRKAKKVDKAKRKAMSQASEGASGGVATATMVAAPSEYTEDKPRVDVTADEYGVTRRKFFNRAIALVFGLFMIQFAIASLAFIWPKVKGGFGTPVNAGSFDAIKAEVSQGGSVIPLFVASAQSWVVPFAVEELAGSSFEDTPFVIAGGESDGVGLMAIWQRCVHLGCRVPSCESSQGFECPCHGSKYNRHGEYEDGPAPRNLDRFAVDVNDGGDLIIDTGTVVQTARSKNKTVPYPQGPFCVG